MMKGLLSRKYLFGLFYKIKRLILFLLVLQIGLTLESQEGLQLEGAIKIGNSKSATPSSGTIRWNGTDLEVWNGSDWISMTKGQPIADLDGNIYPTVKIGTQEWMVDNLRTTKYRSGASVPYISDNTDWSNETDGAWCWYGNSSSSDQSYGKLYNWYAVVDSRGLCPAGWHVPSDGEWTTLAEFLGGNGGAGGPLKEEGTTHWSPPNTDATNESGFTGRPGGYRNTAGNFSLNGLFGFWWTRTSSGTADAWFRGLIYNDVLLNRNVFNRKYGFSVRCIKD